jgi:hypothetical protein
MNSAHPITPPPGDLDPSTDMVTCADAARLMVAASAADVETRYGGAVEVWTIESDGDLVHASGPRLLLWGGMQLWWRFLDHQGMPHRAELHIVESRYKSDARASLTLQIVAVAVDRAARLHDRCAVTGSVSLTAVHCDRIVDTDSVPATFYDLSLSGVALLVNDDRVRLEDRFLLRTRFIEGAIDTDVRIARVVQLPAGQGLLVGASFLQPTAQLAAIVEQVVTRFGRHRHAVDTAGIRELLGITPEVATPGDRPVFGSIPAFGAYPGMA